MKKLLLIAVYFTCTFFANTSLAKNTESVWVDVRSTLEFKMGSIDNAVHIPHGDINERLAELPANKSAKIYLFCGSGKRAGKAQKILQEAGYTNVENLGGLEEAKEFKKNINLE